MWITEKYKTKKEAYRRAYDMLPIETYIYRGHRHYVLQWFDMSRGQMFVA